MTGSGKTTFALRYLLNVSAACRFVFDDLGRVATRLRLRPCYTATELEASLSTRWVIFNPTRMFEGQPAAAFQFFCQWTYQCSKRGPGKKVVLVDEVWQHCSPNAIPRELATLAQAGREENVELITATQLPHKYHSSILGQSTELVCFRLDERLALDAVEGLGAERTAVQQLPLGSFIAWNRLSRGQLRGKVF
jgi:hypothetical protein